MNFEILLTEPAQKIYIAILSVVVTQAFNIIFQNRKTKKEDKRKKYESFYQEVIHDIYNLFKTMNAFRSDSLIGNPYEQKEKLMEFIESNKKLLEKNSFKAYQELKEFQLFEDGSGIYQDILEVKLFAKILEGYQKLYKPSAETYKVLCLIQIWRISLVMNTTNYTVVGEVLKYSHEFIDSRLNKSLYKSLLKINNDEQKNDFKNILLGLVSSDTQREIVENIVNIPEHYQYYEDSFAIAKLHMLEIYEQDTNLSIEDRQNYRNLILQYLYSIHVGNQTVYDDHFHKTEDLNNLLKITLDYLIEKNLVLYNSENNCYQITAKGIDEYEIQHTYSDGNKKS